MADRELIGAVRQGATDTAAAITQGAADTAAAVQTSQGALTAAIQAAAARDDPLTADEQIAFEENMRDAPLTAQLVAQGRLKPRDLLVKNDVVSYERALRNRRIERVIGGMPLWLLALTWGALLFLIIITQGSGDAFIYFQF